MAMVKVKLRICYWYFRLTYEVSNIIKVEAMSLRRMTPRG